MSLKHCWHGNEVDSSKICCWCGKSTNKTAKKYFSDDGQVIITCKLNKESFSYAEGYRMNQKGIKDGFIIHTEAQK